MIKKRYLSDGTVEVEGTPEELAELAELEKNQKPSSKTESKTKGKRILNEDVST